MPGMWRYASASTAAAVLSLTPALARAAEGLNLFPHPPFLLANLVVFALLIYPESV